MICISVKYWKWCPLLLLHVFAMVSSGHAQKEKVETDSIWQPKVELSAGLFSPLTYDFKKEDRGINLQYLVSLKRSLNPHWMIGSNIAWGSDQSTVEMRGYVSLFNGLIIDVSGDRSIIQRRFFQFYGAGYVSYMRQTQELKDIPGDSIMHPESITIWNSIGLGLGLGFKVSFLKHYFFATEFAISGMSGKWKHTDISGCNCVIARDNYNVFFPIRIFSVVLGVKF